MLCSYLAMIIITTGAISISKIMTANCVLQQLVMDDNNIGDNGTFAIAEAVRNCKIKKNWKLTIVALL